MSAIRTADGWRVALLYVALTLLLAYPLTTDPAGRLLSTGPDPNLFMWILAWDTHALTHNPLAIFDANIYYPELHALAYSENLIGSAPFAAPVLWLTGNAVLAMNVVSLLSSVLCGLGAFFLARRIGVSTPAGVLSGLVFAFSPPHFLRFDQLHLTTIQWMPFSLAFLHTYLKEGRPRDLRAAAAFFTLQALTSGHGAAFLLTGILVLIGCRLALGERPAVMRRIRDLGIRGTLLLAPTLLILVPYRSVQTAMHLTRGVADWTTEPSSFLASPTHVHAFALSSIGLMVGGVGVVAIMMISVTERTREIGVRKALGATRREILWQFLVEAATLTLVGGAAGMIAGGGIAWLISVVTPIPAYVPAWSIAAALGASALTGVGFGLYPANRAARLDPVDALRYE